MGYPHVLNTVHHLKKFCSGTIAPELKWTIHGANINVAKLHCFPLLRKSPYRIKQYFHPHPVNSNSDEAFRQPPTSREILQLCLGEVQEASTINLMGWSSWCEVALEVVLS
jgi:hypothetical protein